MGSIQYKKSDFPHYARAMDRREGKRQEVFGDHVQEMDVDIYLHKRTDDKF